MRADRRFEAMGTRVHVLVVADSELRAVRLARDAEQRIAQLESRWSRFRPDSELNRLNAAAGTPAVVSPDTVRLVESMRVGYSVTEGAYDPTVLHDITALGYNQNFKGVVSGSYSAPKRRPAVVPLRGRFGEITVSPVSGLVWLPAGVVIDPGGIGKGLAADIVAEELRATGALGALVNLGGDLRVIGEPDDGACWWIDIEDAVTGEPNTRIALVDGGLATSSTETRSWRHNGDTVHHLIDPASGRSTDRAIIGASVIAREAWRAEVLTKVCIVRGGHGLALVDRFGAAARLTRHDGRGVANPAWFRHEHSLEGVGV